MSYAGETTGSGTTPTVVSSTPYTVLAADEILLVTVASAVINLLAIADHATKSIVVKDKTGTATSQHITINADAGETVDGNATRSLTSNYQSYQLVGNGTEWSIV